MNLKIDAYNKCECELSKLKYLLNENELEYDRLSSLIDAKHNPYGKYDESLILESLNNILCMGFDSKLFTSVDEIQKYEWLRSYGLLIFQH